ncbi:MAG: ABC transporter permease subunit [Turicibacter sp.]|nr:ABC transporter permease subunit [Turicibacter sp.]
MNINVNGNGKIALSSRSQQMTSFLIAVGAIGLFVISLTMINLDLVAFVGRLYRIPHILSLFMALEFSIFGEAIGELVVSIAMALAALLLGGVISLFLSFLAADNTAPSKTVAAAIKGLVSTIRAIPNIVLILMIMAALGLGPVAAVTSLTLSSIGYFTKAFASTIEEQDTALIESMRATGASWFQILVHGFFPNVMPSFLAWISIRLEMSISESISLGVIGAGGIGTMLSRAIRTHRHAEVSMLILIIFVTMLTIEILLNIVKKKANT